MIIGLNHANVITRDLEASAAFYEALGLKRGERPNFGNTGIWLYNVDGLPILHLNDEAELGVIKGAHSAIHHVGLSVRGSVGEITDKLAKLHIVYDLWAPVPGCCRALYFNGPSGEHIEFVMVDNFVPVNHFAGIEERVDA